MELRVVCRVGLKMVLSVHKYILFFFALGQCLTESLGKSRIRCSKPSKHTNFVMSLYSLLKGRAACLPSLALHRSSLKELVEFDLLPEWF